VSDAKKKILIVEDEDNLRELVQDRLVGEGFDVVAAADGFQALAKARTFLPNLIILDLMIPKMDGYSICRLLKSGGMAGTPIIMFSARSSPDDVRRGLDMGASAYISKPFDAPVLLAKIRELLFPAETAREKEAAMQEPVPSPATGAAATEEEPRPAEGQNQSEGQIPT
jgi:DNA-binding response OmpR family regulator